MNSMQQRDLQQLIDELDAIDRRVDALVAPLSDAQFFWQPDEGRSWSIAQCLEHLTSINGVYGNAILAGIESARARGLTGGGPISPTYPGRKFITSMEPPVKRRMRAPRQAIPGPPRSREDIVRAFTERQDWIRGLVRGAADLDVNRATFKNPFLPLVRMRVGTGLRVITAHDRRHVWQAEKVTRAAGFPTPG
jgi:DinB superfamily